MQRHHRYLLAIIFAGLLTAPVARGDSVRAECGFAASVDAPRDVTSACTFSQRQGFITVYIDSGPEFDFRPADNAPGNYIDANGQPVYRRSGLGKRGTIFQLPDRFLFVYWPGNTLDCAAEAFAENPGCVLDYGGLIFRVRASNDGSTNQLTVESNGLEAGPQEFTHAIDGMVYRAEVADLDANGWPEIYIYISSAGSGSYGSLVAYAVNNGKSMTPVYLPPLTNDVAASAGYMGHDEFRVVENRLVQRFPVYREGDTNGQPTGGTRQLQYRLIPGEAGWVLEVDKVVEY